MKRFFNILIIAVTFSTAACSSKVKTYNPNKERKFFSVAVRQLPPEPVYNRLTTAYLPEPLPSRDIRRASYSRLSPVFQFEMKDATLEQTARILANMNRYTSYCSSVIAQRKINLTAVGTIDEIAEQVSNRAGINVSVDHANREVRFLANGGSSMTRTENRSNSSSNSSNRPAVQTKKVIKNYPASTMKVEGLSGDVKVSDKTDGFLNNIKIEG